MEVEMIRTLKPHATYSDARVIGDNKETVFEYKTLELPWKDNHKNVSCIPAGEYLVEKCQPTIKRPYVYFHVLNVPNRDGILWHPGNYTHQILGCILPGERHIDLDHDGKPDIANTTGTLKILAALLPDKFKLTIK